MDDNNRSSNFNMLDFEAFNNETSGNRDGTDDYRIQYKLRSGEAKTFEIGRSYCDPFGFYYGERIRVRGGRKAWVIGVRNGEGEVPNLFFHIDGDKGASYYSGYKKEEFERDGFVLISPRMTFVSLQPSDNENTFSAAPLLKLLEDDCTFSDVSFTLGDSNEPIKAHRNILMARSNYFRAMFTSGMKESRDNSIKIEDVTVDTFKQILHFLYSGQVNIDTSNVAPLITAAHRFQIDDLKRMCYLAFPKVVAEDNVVPLLLLSESYGETTLKDLCTSYILQHYQNLVSSGKIAELIATENRTLVLEIMSHLSPPATTTSAKKKQRVDLSAD